MGDVQKEKQRIEILTKANHLVSSNNQQPTTNNQQPTTNNQQPTCRGEARSAKPDYHFPFILNLFSPYA